MIVKAQIFIDHYTAQAWDVDQKLLNDPELLLKKSLEIAQELNLTVLNHFIHQFQPYGLSLILIISESHFALHTWPELGYLHIDVLSCSRNTNLKNLAEVLEKYLKTRKIKVKRVAY